MEHLIFGHAGAPVLVFPTSKGRFFQWEDFQMIEALAEPLERGWIQLFCVDSIDELSWYNFVDHQRVQLDWHLAYEDFLIHEFLPHLRIVNPTEFLVLSGASFGGFHAVNFGLRYPQLVDRVVAMSGDYEAQKYVDGYFDSDVLANSPLDRLRHLSDHDPAWNDIRTVEFRLLTGRHDFCLPPTVALHNQLRNRGVNSVCHIWDDPGIHDWPLWRRQARHNL